MSIKFPPKPVRNAKSSPKYNCYKISLKFEENKLL